MRSQNPQVSAIASIDDREGAFLKDLTAWMENPAEAIHGTKPEKICDISLGRVQGPMFYYGMWTSKGTTGYFTFFYYPGDYVVVSKIAPGIKSAELLTTGKPLEVEPTTNGRTVIKGLPKHSPDPVAPSSKSNSTGLLTLLPNSALNGSTAISSHSISP